MLPAAATPRKPARHLPRPVFTSTCAACETVMITADPVLPEHWQVEEIGGETYAYCPDCARDLPETAQ